ncbi:MAG TPA: DsbA family protein [Solirubrobacteraceae bacterium]
MGDLIYLDARRKPQFEPPQDVRPTFFFDLACPFSYLVAERVERMLGDAEWVPVSAGAQLQGAEAAASRDRAALRARQLRLPLVWPERFPAAVPSALRAAAHAAELGAGARFALAAFRLAFCGGYDLEDPEALAVAAATARVSLDGCLQAAGDRSEDEALLIAADELRSRGMNTVPVIEAGGRMFEGEAGLLSASKLLRADAATTAR